MPSKKEDTPEPESASTEEESEVEQMVREEMMKTKKMTNLRNAQG